MIVFCIVQNTKYIIRTHCVRGRLRIHCRSGKQLPVTISSEGSKGQRYSE